MTTDHDGTAARPGPGRWLSIGVLAAGVALFIAGVAGVIVTFVTSIVDAPTFPVPGTARVHLDARPYDLYQATNAAAVPSAPGEPGIITASDVTVTAADGSAVPVHPPGSSVQTLSRGQTSYTAVATFQAPAGGDYTIRVTDGFGRGRVLVAPTLGSIVRSTLGWALLAIVGFLVAVTGLVLLVVGISRRRRAAAAAWVAAGHPASPPLPPPGWYRDPGGAPTRRWWDGRRWTDHIG